MVAKEVKLMAFAEGIRIQQCMDEPHITLKAWLQWRPLGCLHMKSLQWYLETLRISPVSGYSTSCVSGSQGSSLVMDQSFHS